MPYRARFWGDGAKAWFGSGTRALWLARRHRCESWSKSGDTRGNDLKSLSGLLVLRYVAFCSFPFGQLWYLYRPITTFLNKMMIMDVYKIEFKVRFIKRTLGYGDAQKAVDPCRLGKVLGRSFYKLFWKRCPGPGNFTRFQIINT